MGYSFPKPDKAVSVTNRRGPERARSVSCAKAPRDKRDATESESHATCCIRDHAGLLINNKNTFKRGEREERRAEGLYPDRLARGTQAAATAMAATTTI